MPGRSHKPDHANPQSLIKGHTKERPDSWTTNTSAQSTAADKHSIHSCIAYTSTPPSTTPYTMTPLYDYPVHDPVHDPIHNPVHDSIHDPVHDLVHDLIYDNPIHNYPVHDDPVYNNPIYDPDPVHDPIHRELELLMADDDADEAGADGAEKKLHALCVSRFRLAFSPVPLLPYSNSAMNLSYLYNTFHAPIVTRRDPCRRLGLYCGRIIDATDSTATKPSTLGLHLYHLQYAEQRLDPRPERILCVTSADIDAIFELETDDLDSIFSRRS
ncbi:uncharacterized protein PV07_08795 [Cladophialophora immunda]|uniref:Uncharacterized protein n=1 Tax=Cladophialophora immunda TaxID=569365 RepID=A0A0D2CPX0_9EURO|nr:uncharacterized protein PV07_08795 [Cladophialophora immunda]KIW25629.1 hypothetical protein PV07_08795 [Cladophialophora immunda]